MTGPSDARGAEDVHRPYVPRLAQGWSSEGPAWQALTGCLVSADVSGFTALSERLASLGREGAEELTSLLNRVFTSMIAEVDAHGGDIVKFGGDALLVLFTGHEHTARACAAALAMRRTLTQPLHTTTSGRVRLRMSVGLHTGTFHAFAVVAGHHEVFLTGEATTTCIEQEAAAEAGQIRLSPAAARAVDASWTVPGPDGGALLRNLRRLDLPPTASSDDVTGPAATWLPAGLRVAIAGGATHGEHRHVVPAFIRFGGTDDLLASEGPDIVLDRLQALAEVVAASTRRFDVHWLATDVYPGGGKVILSGGAPSASAADEEGMLRAVRRILDQARGLPLRAGVNRGLVFVGDLGGPTRRTFTIMGDGVNLAARLMQKAGEGDLIASRDVVDRAGCQVTATALPPFLVKGKTRPIEALNVAAVHAGRSTQAARAATPLIGRDHELAIILEAVDEARRGRGSSVDVVGDVGMGKTRLVQEVLARSPDVQHWVVRADPYAATTPYAAVRDLLREIVGIPTSAEPDAAGAILQDGLAADTPHLRPWAPLLAVVLGAAVPETEEVRRLAPQFRVTRLHDAMAGLLAHRVTRPGIVVVEDGHALDEATRDLLDALLARAGDVPCAWIFTRRAGPAPPTTASLVLSPLAEDAARELIAAVAGDATPHPDRVAAMTANAGGNPLFLHELAAGAGGASDDLPDTIEVVVTSRIDTLAAPLRQRLREAAVLGGGTPLSEIADVVDDPALQDVAAWEDLQDFVSVVDGRLRFAHELHRQVAYDGLSFRRRRELHDRAVDVLAVRRPDEVGRLAAHASHARRHREAFQYGIEAGDQAVAAYANADAIAAYELALNSARLLSDLPRPTLAGVAERLGDVAERAARIDVADGAYARARRLVDDELREVRLLHKQGVLREREGRYVSALRWYGRALRRLEARTDRRLRAELRVAYAGVRFRQGRPADAARWAEQALADAEAAEAEAIVAHACYLLDLIDLAQGRPGGRARRALPIYEDLGDLVGKGNTLNNMGIAAYYAGDWTAATEHYRASRQARSQAGDVIGEAMSANNLGEVLSDQGRIDEAIELFTHALRSWRGARYPIGVATATSNLGRAQGRRGDLTAARLLLDEAEEALEDLGASASLLEVRLRRAEALLIAGEVEEAGEHLEEVAARITSGDPAQVAAFHRLSGMVAWGRGRRDDALRSLQSSLATAEEHDLGFERALTLDAQARVMPEGEHADATRQAADAALAALGVVRLPASPPIPRSDARRRSPRSGRLRRVRLVHFSDYHAHAAPFYAEGEHGTAGVARLIAYLREVRSRAVVTNGGDMLNVGWPPWSDHYRGIEWPWFNGLVDMMALGNHDADYGPELFGRRRAGLDHPVLCANLVGADDQPLLTHAGRPYLVREVDGVSLGLLAAAGPDFDRLVPASSRPIAGARFSDRTATVEQLVAELRGRERVNAVVLVGHGLAEDDQALARDVPGIDVVLGTHSHRRQELTGIAGSDAVMVSPFQYATYVADLDLTFRGGALVDVAGGLVQMSADRPEAPDVAAEVARLRTDLDADPRYAHLAETVAHTDHEISPAGHDQGESVLGNLVTDVMRDRVGADAVLMTADSIRAPLPPGEVTVGHVHAALPYDNHVLVYRLTGQRLQDLLDASVRQCGSGRHLQVAGVGYASAGGRAVQVHVARGAIWESIDPDASYEVALNDFTAQMVPAYSDVLAGLVPRDPGQEVRDLVIEGLRAVGHLEAGLDGRVRGPIAEDVELDHPA